MSKPEYSRSAPRDANSGPPRPVLIFRQVSFSLDAFDRLKAWQRRLELAGGRPLTNGEVLDVLILAAPVP